MQEQHEYNFIYLGLLKVTIHKYLAKVSETKLAGKISYI